MGALELQDIHLPESASFWPLAIGWWIVLIALIVLIAWLVFFIFKRNKQRKYRSKICARFDVLEQQLKTKPSNTVIAEINTLLRQLAVTYYPREKIASLTGADWLHFLDEVGKTEGFSKGAGRILIDAPYRADSQVANKNQVENLNRKEFITLVRKWTRRVVRINS